EKFFLQITALLDSDTPKEELFRIVKALFKTPGSNCRWSAARAENQHLKLQQLELIDNHNRCHPEILEQVARRPLEKRLLDLCRQLIRSSFIDSDAQADETFNLCAKNLRDFRLALFSHDFESLQKALPIFHEADYDPRFRHPYAALTIHPFNQEWFLKLPLPFQFAALDDSVTHALEDLSTTPELDNFIREHFLTDKAQNRPFILLYTHKLLLSGRLAELDQIYNRYSQLFNGSGLKGAISVMKGNLAAAAAEFAADLELAQTVNPNKIACFDAPIALFYIITAGHIQTSTDWTKVTLILNIGEQEFAYNPFTRDLFRLGETLLHFFRGFTEAAQKSLELVEKRPDKSIFTLLNNLVSYWLTGSVEDGEQKKLKNLKALATENNFPWIALESATLLALNTPESKTEPSPQHLETRLKALSPAFNFEPAWRRTLNAIRQVTPGQNLESSAAESEAASRLAWFVEISREHSLRITPKIQKLNPESSWSIGRNLAFERIQNGDELPFFSTKDRRICRAIRKAYNQNEGPDESLDQGEILKELVGHPHIFRDDRPQIPVLLSAGEVAIIISKKTGPESTFTIRLDPDLHGRDCVTVAQSENRFVFYRNNPELKNIARLLGNDGLTLPLEAQDDIITTIRELAATLPIFSDLDPGLNQNHNLHDHKDSETADNHSDLYLQIFPSGNGLTFDLKVKPLGPSGP
ncbi:MAG: hypothetical protein KAG92_00095, partial [Deltaproteobacteria bacterium]|nr:hypothetical protein [Deltaproteobacteria bacterium]